MAKFNLSLCDYCHKLSKKEFNHFLILRKGKAKGGELTKAEICEECFDKFLSRIEAEVTLDGTNNPIKPTTNKNQIQLDDDAAIVPSNTDYDTAYNKPTGVTCKHENTSFDPPNVTCKKCGEVWTA